MTDDWRSRIERAIEDHNLPMKAVSLRAGLGETFVRDMLKRDRKPSADNLAAVERAISELTGQPISAPPRAGIPNLRIFAGMGHGGLEEVQVDESGRPLPEFTDGDWNLPERVQTRLGRLKGVYAVPVEGDSMSPTIKGGSVAIIDTNLTRPNPPGLFAVDFGDGLLVKRVELIGGTSKISIASDNSAYRTYEFPRDDVRVWGRVVAVWGWMD